MFSIHNLYLLLDCQWSDQDICKVERDHERNIRRFFRTNDYPVIHRKDWCIYYQCKQQYLGNQGP